MSLFLYGYQGLYDGGSLSTERAIFSPPFRPFVTRDCVIIAVNWVCFVTLHGWQGGSCGDLYQILTDLHGQGAGGSSALPVLVIAWGWVCKGQWHPPDTLPMPCDGAPTPYPFFTISIPLHSLILSHLFSPCPLDAWLPCFTSLLPLPVSNYYLCIHFVLIWQGNAEIVHILEGWQVAVSIEAT